MYYLLSLVIFCFVQNSDAFNTNYSICCQDLGNHCFTNDYPFNRMVTLPECFLPTFNLSTRTASNITLTTSQNVPPEFDGFKKTIFVIHGWNDNAQAGWMAEMTLELLTKGDFNVIEVDWSNNNFRGYSVEGYQQTAANTRVNGKAVADLFQHLITNGGLSRTNGHCAGHSLGAQTCGLAGQFIKFGRISGMDPAGPEFELAPPGARLSKDDADFVDVIHTDGGGGYLTDYGSLIPMGHVDFYANGGVQQPGCWVNRKKEITEEEKLLEAIDVVVRGAIGCSHGRAVSFYIASINRYCFKAMYNCTDPNFAYKDTGYFWSTGTCSECDHGKTCTIMGFNSFDYKTVQGLFYVETTAVKPYCI